MRVEKKTRRKPTELNMQTHKASGESLLHILDWNIPDLELDKKINSLV